MTKKIDNAIIGCPIFFKIDGKAYILSKSRVRKIVSFGIETGFMVARIIDKEIIFISSITSWEYSINKKFCKII